MPSPLLISKNVAEGGPTVEETQLTTAKVPEDREKEQS